MTCLNPVSVYRRGTFPCGKCTACRIQKAREWSQRLMDELGYWDKSVFVTLTYSDENLPKNNSLRKKDLQDFLKRLRKYSNAKIKYYGCGEYGDNKKHIDYGHGLGRPHYHIIIFGLGSNEIDTQFIKDAWRKCVWSNFQNEKAFGTVTFDSCRYVADYIQKKYSGPLADEVYTSKQIEPPFRLSSLGLGLRYCLDNSDYLRGTRHCQLRNVRTTLPRYYMDKIGLKFDRWNHDDLAARALESDKKFERLKTYVNRHGYDVQDIAELQESWRNQRAENLERKNQLFKKGEL